MPENAVDAASGYVDAVKWIVGLSAAAAAGVFLHPEQLPQKATWGKYLITFLVLLLVLNIGAGAIYLLWINRVRRIKERLKEIQEELLPVAIKRNPRATQTLAGEKYSLRRELKDAPKEMQSWYWLLVGSWVAAAFIAALILVVAIWSPRKTAEDNKVPFVSEPLRFTITQSAIHNTKNGRQAHTFLLNQQTGEMWQMICDRHGTVTAFQRVGRLDLNGNPEKDEPEKKP